MQQAFKKSACNNFQEEKINIHYVSQRMKQLATSFRKKKINIHYVSQRIDQLAISFTNRKKNKMQYGSQRKILR